MRMTPSTFDRRIFARFSSFCGVEDYGRFRCSSHVSPAFFYIVDVYIWGLSDVDLQGSTMMQCKCVCFMVQG
jgi:hypothetical protein